MLQGKYLHLLFRRLFLQYRDQRQLLFRHLFLQRRDKHHLLFRRHFLGVRKNSNWLLNRPLRRADGCLPQDSQQSLLYLYEMESRRFHNNRPDQFEQKCYRHPDPDSQPWHSV